MYTYLSVTLLIINLFKGQGQKPQFTSWGIQKARLTNKEADSGQSDSFDKLSAEIRGYYLIQYEHTV